MSKLLPNLIPPFRYATVEEGLFRGGYPKARNLRFMKRYTSYCSLILAYIRLDCV